MKSAIDLNFRPASYFSERTQESTLLTSVMGSERRKQLKALIKARRLDLADEALLRSKLSTNEATAAGSIHPVYLSGECLPALRLGELEIARIRIATTTGDVCSVRARMRKARIFYRVVDEYESGNLAEPTTRTSAHPLSLGELFDFIVLSFGLFESLERNFEDEGFGESEMLEFVEADSVFYPQFEALCRKRIIAWGRERRATGGRL